MFGSPLLIAEMGKSWTHGILYIWIFSEFGILSAWGEIIIGGDAHIFDGNFHSFQWVMSDWVCMCVDTETMHLIF